MTAETDRWVDWEGQREEKEEINNESQGSELNWIDAPAIYWYGRVWDFYIVGIKCGDHFGHVEHVMPTKHLEVNVNIDTKF